MGGNSANTMIEVPVPGDTLVNQNIQTRTGLAKKTYQPNSTEYESVMQRVRPLFKYFEVPALQEGGSTPDVDLNGRQMRGLANLDRDFDRGQANRAY